MLIILARYLVSIRINNRFFAVKRAFPSVKRQKGEKIMCTKKDPMEKRGADGARTYEAVELRITYFTAADVFMDASTDAGSEFPSDWE